MPLTTTGTLQVTGWDNRTVYDRAYGALGLTPQQVTSEKIDIARDLLGITLADMVNTASPLFCLEKFLVPLIQGQRDYVMPVGTNDLNRAFYRTVNNVTPTLVQNTPTSVQFNFGANNATIVYNVAVTWAGAPVAINIQSSPDGINWTTVASTNSLNQSYAYGPTQWYDVNVSAPQQYWQIVPQNAVTGPLSITSAVLYNTPNDIEMYRMNKDDYYNMVNKSFEGRPLQYYLDRQSSAGTVLTQPIMQLWPVADANAAQNLMMIRRERYIQDVGSLQNQIEVPTRWFYTVIMVLAEALAFCTPEAKPDRIAMVQAKVPEMLSKLWTGERDRSPFKMNFNIGAYTR
jgi:hypothetical protein